MRGLLVCFLLGCLISLPLAAIGQDPSMLDRTYRVELRYKIDAGRQLRYQLFQKFTQRLAAAGFQKDEGQEGEELFGTRMTGTLPGRSLPALLRDPFVQTALLVPQNFQGEDEPVLVRFYLTTSLGLSRQKEVAAQARTLLKPLGFEESVGSNTSGGEQLLGRLPFNRLKDLLTTQFDVVATSAAAPGMTVVKTALIRAAVVLPEPEGFQAVPAAAAAAEANGTLRKASPALRAWAASAGGSEGSTRVEVILRNAPEFGDGLLDLQATGLSLLGRLGPVVFGTADVEALRQLANQANVSSLRLPQSATQFTHEAVEFAPLGRQAQPAAQPVAWVRRVGPSRAVVIASDFRGYEALKGSQLPSNTQLLDFTPELSNDLLPAPPAAGEGPGAGTQLAVQLVQGGGIDELLLARIDPAAPFQVESIAEVVSGKEWQSPALRRRMYQLREDQVRLEERRKELRVLRRLTLDNFGIDDSARAAREKYRAAQAEFDDMESTLRQVSQRLLEFQSATRRLRSVSTVLVGLAWTSGYADLPGSLPLLRYLDPALLQSASWLQAVPVRTDAVWHGLFRDDAGDGIMEFAKDVPAGQRPDLNFLAWQPKDGTLNPDLPAGITVRLQVQWQEAHDPVYAGAAEDLYRQPLAPLRVILLRQRDPSGKALPVDLFDVVAKSNGGIERVENDLRWAVYQLDLEYTVASPGRYAFMLVGTPPAGLAPGGSADVQGQRGELRPKIVVQAVDPNHRAAGRLLLTPYHTGE